MRAGPRSGFGYSRCPEVLNQQDLDLGDALSVDAWTSAGLRAPSLTDALRVILQILPSVLVRRSSRLIVLGERSNALAMARIDMPVSYNACRRVSGWMRLRAIKRQFGYTKVRYRGLAKNTAHVLTLFALSNLWMVRRQLLPARG